MARLIRCARCWKPTPAYLDSPWRCFADFVAILRERGARFVTFRDAIAGAVDEGAINFILDHHIDDYPLETETICRWEREQGARASVYLYARSTHTPAVEGGGTYGLGDLDLDVYRGLERDGFEIGYHQNAIGRAREALEGRAAGKSLTDAIRGRAAALAVEDVAALREHFAIETFIPHGAGQGNYLLTELPEALGDLVWTYNSAASSPHGARRPKFSNWTDRASSGMDPQVIAGFGAHYVCRRDNLALKALLAGPGLHHVLVHAGRFAEGMPYGLAGRDYERRPVHRVSDFDAPPELPLTLAGLAAGRWGGVERAVAALAAGPSGLVRDGAYRLLTDCPRVLGAHLLAAPRCLAHLVRHEPFDRRAAGVVRTRRPGTIRGPRRPRLPEAGDLPDRVEDAFMADGPHESVRPFCNEVYAKRLFAHLRDAPVVFDVIALRRATIGEPGELAALGGVLERYAATGSEVAIRSRMAMGVDARGAWLRRAALRGVMGAFEVDVRDGGSVLEIRRGRTGLLQRVAHVVGIG